MPLTGQSHILPNHIIVFQWVAIEKVVEAVIEVPILMLLLQQRAIDCLSLCIDHLYDFGLFLIPLLLLYPHDRFGRLRRQTLHFELEWLNHGIGDQIGNTGLSADFLLLLSDLGR